MNYKQTVVEYVEGRMSYNEFHSLILTDDAFAEWINQNAPSEWRCYTKATKANNYTAQELPYTIRDYLKQNARMETEGSIGYRLNLQSDMERFLQRLYPELTIQPDMKIHEISDLVLDACPAYIGGTEVWASGLIEQLVDECSDDWTRSKKRKYIKERIVDEFHVQDKKHPRWIQNPEWPFSNGKPMKFEKTTVKYKGEWYQHHFVDIETGEERIVDDIY